MNQLTPKEDQPSLPPILAGATTLRPASERQSGAV
jgi:hypothetical protein